MTRWRLAAPIDDIRTPLIAGARMGAHRHTCRVSGSAPRDVGAQMLITDAVTGVSCRAASGLMLRGWARRRWPAGRAQLLHMVRGSPWIDIKLACGCGIAVLVEPWRRTTVLGLLLGGHCRAIRCCD
jgi:xanthine dehydrogenase accessory factor